MLSGAVETERDESLFEKLGKLGNGDVHEIDDAPERSLDLHLM